MNNGYWHQLTSLRVGLAKCEVVDAPVPDAHILGAGTNVIGRDEDDGRPVLCLPPAPAAILPDGLLAAPAALPLVAAAIYAARAGLGGLAPLSGIPGTLGGAAAMNAGAHGVEIAEFLEWMEGVELATAAPWRWERGDGGFAYRRSPVPQGVVVTRLALRLPAADPDAEKAAIAAEHARRRAVNPQGPSAGSVFANPPGAPPAGKLLEEAGCKGLSVGNLVVSDRHANWILNPGGRPESAAHARELVALLQARVAARFGIALRTEWRWM